MVFTKLNAKDWKPNLDSKADNKSAYNDLNFLFPISEFGKVDPCKYNIYLKINDPLQYQI